MSGPAMAELVGWLSSSYIDKAILLVLGVLILKGLGVTDLMLGKFGIKIDSKKRSAMTYVRAMLNVERQRQAIEQRNIQEARRKTRNMIDIVVSHILAVEMNEIQSSGAVNTHWKDLPFRSLLRGEVKDEIMTKAMEIYERNGLGEYSEKELDVKIEKDFRDIVTSASSIIQDGWTNTEIAWQELYDVLATGRHKEMLLMAFSDCIKSYRNLSLKKAVEYAKIDELIEAIEEAANGGQELPKGCYDDPTHSVRGKNHHVVR